MSYLGLKIRELRNKNGTLQRELAEYIGIDLSLLSRVERGERVLHREQVSAVAHYFQQSDQDLLSLWICDKVLGAVEEEPCAEHGITRALSVLKEQRR